MYFNSGENRLNGWINAIRKNLSADGVDTVGMAIKLRGLCAVGHKTEDDGIKTAEGLTVRSLLYDCPESSLLWRTLYEVALFDGAFDSFYRILTDNCNSASDEVNVGAVKREINKLAPKINEKNIETRFPFIEDAIYIWASALGYKPVKATTLNTANIAESLLSGARFEKDDVLFKLNNALKVSASSALKTLIEYLIGKEEDKKSLRTQDKGVFEKITGYILLLDRYVARQTEAGEVTNKTLKEIDAFIYEVMAVASEISGKIRATESFTALHDELEYLRCELLNKKRLAERKKPEIELLNYLDFADDKLYSFIELLEASESISECSALINDCNALKCKAEALWRDFTDKCEETDALKLQKRYNTLISDFNRFVSEAGGKKLKIEKEIRKRDFNEMRAQFEAVITSTRIYAEQYETAKLSIVHSRSEARKLVSETNANISRLENLRGEANKRGKEFTSSVPMEQIDELKKLLEEYRRVAEAKSKDPSLVEVLDEGITIDKDGWNMTVDENLSVQFSLMDEDYSELMFDGGKSGGETTGVHDFSAYHKLVDSAVDVKRQPIFSDYGDITVYPYFKPFGYQVDSVRTMLSRFEGRGIFGDQVGLGKTLQALLTAHVMYKCGAIRNAVIVASKTNIAQWRSEAENKFRDENGEPMFELYPQGRELSYGFEELIKELKQDNATKTDALKIYFTTVGAIKGSASLKRIQQSNEAADYAYEATRLFKTSEIGDGFNPFKFDVSAEKNRKKLEYVADLLLKNYYAAVENDEAIKDASRLVRGGYSYSVQGKNTGGGEIVFQLRGADNCEPSDYDWDADKDWKITELTKGLSYNEVGKYNARLKQIRDRINEIDNELQTSQQNNLYNEQRLIDLLIFDEVQELLVGLGESKKDKDSAAIQEFIARIQKKYCILISATPIKNDLSDIFNLAYMVDKNRLGDTREEAEKRFYNGYCGGCRSLSQMANAKDSKKQFQTLNGLINSMFTRKRLYDKDVVASMRRQCATREEIEYAEARGRDDYGGEKFYKLVKALSLESAYAEHADEKTLAETDGYRKEIFPDVKQEDYHKYLGLILESINKSSKTVLMRLQVRHRQKQFTNIEIDICAVYLDRYDELLSLEKQNKYDKYWAETVYDCNLLCSYINRGLLDFYRARHDFSTVFLSDYIDWRRPVKRGEKVACSGRSKQQVMDMFADAFVPDDEEAFSGDGCDGAMLSRNDVILLQQSKVLYFETGVDNRRDMYRAIRKANQTFGEPRNIYINIGEDATAKYTADELVDLCRYSAGSGAASHRIISAKSAQKRTWKEQLFIDTWSDKGKPLVCDGKREDAAKFINFTRFSDRGAEEIPNNWNAIYFMDKEQKAGTDLNAANALVIAQLDIQGTYLDPLDMEQLIGRISRTGQTEECVLFTCLYNGDDKTNDEKFNAVYYDILTDKKGFDLFGSCQTEVDFVVPVVMACARRLFSPEHSYTQSEENTEKFAKDKSDFKAVFLGKKVPLNAEKFPELLRYAFDNKGKVRIFCTDNDWVEEDGGAELGADMVGSIDGAMQTRVLNPIEAIKKMIRVYAKVLSHETTVKKEK